MRQGLVVGLMLLLAGCGGPPPPNAAEVAMAPPPQDAAGKQFNPPPPGMAAVYFYDPIPVGPGIVVSADQQRVGRLGPQTWMRVELSAGWHTMGCSAVNSANQLSLNLAPGDMRFVDVEMPPDQPVCTIRETGPDVGRNAVLQGGRALQVQ